MIQLQNGLATVKGAAVCSEDEGSPVPLALCPALLRATEGALFGGDQGSACTLVRGSELVLPGPLEFFFF